MRSLYVISLCLLPLFLPSVFSLSFSNNLLILSAPSPRVTALPYRLSLSDQHLFHTFKVTSTEMFSICSPCFMCPTVNSVPWFSIQILSHFPSFLLTVPTLSPTAPHLPALGRVSTHSHQTLHSPVLSMHCLGHMTNKNFQIPQSEPQALANYHHS